MTDTPDKFADELFDRIAVIVEAARTHVARTVNVAMVHAYWHVGREIVEVEQRGDARAAYGERVLPDLAKRLRERFGKGFSEPNLRNMRQFYLTFRDGSAVPEEAGGPPKRSAVPSVSGSSEIRSAVPSESSRLLFPPNLGWTHYAILMRVHDAQARAFYEIEASREGWSTRQLERQIGSLLFERLAKSRDKEQVRALARDGHRIEAAADVIKDPMVLEFLGLEERSHWLERDLEQAIIDRLESFLLELGKGFCFVARQRRLTLEGDHFFVDLVFYNRLLRCFVLVDLKLGKLTHQDLGQMQMYVNFYDRFQREEGEAPTVGIVLCSDKNDAVVKITLPEGNQQIHATRYQLYLPSEEELRAELERERHRAEEDLRLRGDVDADVTSHSHEDE
ncbi:MAG: PDDEXK nuclease domain-containing protein [Deltaproteobacteria bacterium]